MKNNNLIVIVPILFVIMIESGYSKAPAHYSIHYNRNNMMNKQYDSDKAFGIYSTFSGKFKNYYS
jgi:hypothetical protein